MFNVSRGIKLIIRPLEIGNSERVARLENKDHKY